MKKELFIAHDISKPNETIYKKVKLIVTANNSGDCKAL